MAIKKPRGIQPGLSRRLQAWRKRRARDTGETFTQIEAAKELGISYGTYLEYEHGRRGHNMNIVLYRYIVEKTAPSKDND